MSLAAGAIPRQIAGPVADGAVVFLRFQSAVIFKSSCLHLRGFLSGEIWRKRSFGPVPAVDPRVAVTVVAVAVATTRVADTRGAEMAMEVAEEAATAGPVAAVVPWTVTEAIAPTA